MLRLVALVVLIGLADSLNPTTVGPALFLAAGQHGRRRVTEFTVAVFAVYLLGGVAIALGPGRAVLSVFPRPRGGGAHILEIAAGIGLVGIALVVWSRRRRTGRLPWSAPHPKVRSGALLGATISAIELPTAFPYFAAIAAIAGSGVDVSGRILLLMLFNACFVLPLVGIIGMLCVSPSTASILSGARERLQAHSPAVIAGVAFLAGVLVVTAGVAGLSGHPGPGRFI